MNEVKAEFMALAELEPQLLDLLADIKQACRDHRRQKYLCANEMWYGYRAYEGMGFKGRMCKLVGCERDGPGAALKTMHAYDVAYDYLYSQLPNCRGHEGW